jgi:hypothetical protein
MTRRCFAPADMTGARPSRHVDRNGEAAVKSGEASVKKGKAAVKKAKNMFYNTYRLFMLYNIQKRYTSGLNGCYFYTQIF